MKEHQKKYLIYAALAIGVIAVGVLGFAIGQEKKEEAKAELKAETKAAAAQVDSIQMGEEKKAVQAAKNFADAKLAEKKAQAEAEAAALAEAQEIASGKIIALDPGHQSSSVDMSALEPNGPGSSEMKAKCTGGTTGAYTKIPEYQLNMDISLMLKAELESRGYQVVLTREDNETAISNSERALLAADAGADIYVRIHANGSDNASASGALALVPSGSNPYVASLASESYVLAECVLNAYCAQTGFANDGIQQNDTMTGINWSKVPVMILEMGFMSNENDDYSMADPAFRAQMVTGIADGIAQYCQSY